MLYRLGENEDLSFLKERVLIQVCVGLYQIIFYFDQSIPISVEDRFEVSSNSQTHSWQPGDTSGTNEALKLIGNKITQIIISDNSKIELFFTSNTNLRIIPQESKYESYQITHKHRSIIV